MVHVFTPKTEKIKLLAEKYPKRIEQLNSCFEGKTRIYVDYANVLPWTKKLGWHVQPKRLKQLLSSFDTVETTRIYSGTLIGDKASEDSIDEFRKLKYEVITKPVKLMHHSIDVTGIPEDSAAVIKEFIRKPFLDLLSRKIIIDINNELLERNKKGEVSIENRKCNFDVEIGRDMSTDYQSGMIGSFVLWSNDSDFADPIRQLLRDGKRVTVFTTSGRLSRELDALRINGLRVFDIQKIKEFICRNSEMAKEEGII